MMRLASLSGLGQVHGSGCGCNQCRKGRGCCPKNGAYNENRAPISITVSPVQSINSGTQSYQATRTIALPDGRRVDVPVPQAPTAGTILGRVYGTSPEAVPHGEVYTVKEGEPDKDVKYLEFY